MQVVTAHAVAQQAEVRTNVKQGALIGGSVCFVLGIIVMVMSGWLVIFYGPLFFVAFILSIVAMAQRRVLGGVLLLLLTIIVPPVLLIGGASSLVAEKVDQARAQARLSASASPTQPSDGDTNVAADAAAPADTSAPQPPAQTAAPQVIGDSVIIAGVKITVQGARIANVNRESLSGTRESKEKYLIIDVTLENTTQGKIIHLQQVWQNAKLTDNFDNVLESHFSDTYAVSTIVGHVSSHDLRPGEKVSDTIIFDLPVEAATSFTMTVKPGFWKNVGDRRVQRLSEETFTILLKRENIKRS